MCFQALFNKKIKDLCSEENAIMAEYISSIGFCEMFFLSSVQNLDIIFRRDPTNYRPRINNLNSLKNREQKRAGSYYYLDD